MGLRDAPAFGRRWVFSDPNVDALVISMDDEARVDEYLAGSGQSGLRESDAAVLRRYVAARSGDTCRSGCGACASACDQGVPIADVLRQRMYAVDYGRVDAARAGYDALLPSASPCVGCATRSCLGACPHELDIPSLARQTERLLRA